MLPQAEFRVVCHFQVGGRAALQQAGTSAGGRLRGPGFGSQRYGRQCPALCVRSLRLSPTRLADGLAPLIVLFSVCLCILLILYSLALSLCLSLHSVNIVLHSSLCLSDSGSLSVSPFCQYCITLLSLSVSPFCQYCITLLSLSVSPFCQNCIVLHCSVSPFCQYCITLLSLSVSAFCQYCFT